MTDKPFFPRPLLVAAAAAALLAGCAVGPNYQRPTAPEAPKFKEAQGWTPAAPQDGIDKGAWWSMFQDPVLDGLEQRIAISNQTIKEYEAAYRQAHQIVAEARATLFPTVGAQVSATGEGNLAKSRTGGSSNSSSTANAYQAGLDASWAPDLWGKVRRTVEADKATAQSAAATLANARLSAQASLAQDYFQLRVLDEEIRIYTETTANFQKFLTITQNQYKAGTQPKSAVLAAQTQLLGAQAALTDFGVGRAQYEHAIAILVGVAPSELTIVPATLTRIVPVPPTGLPSDLLQRRPDIAEAERTVAAANAQIGVAQAAFYPTLSLTGDVGYSGSNLGGLFNSSNALWSLGATAAETLVDFGERRAAVRAARATYDQEVAVYRQTVLTAFQGVEDELAALRVLQKEQDERLASEAAANKTVELDLNEYKAGTITYTTVITDQATALTASQNVVTVLGQRLVASVLLVENLGGGWTAANLPKG